MAKYTWHQVLVFCSLWLYLRLFARNDTNYIDNMLKLSFELTAKSSSNEWGQKFTLLLIRVFGKKKLILQPLLEALVAANSVLSYILNMYVLIQVIPVSQPHFQVMDGWPCCWENHCSCFCPKATGRIWLFAPLSIQGCCSLRIVFFAVLLTEGQFPLRPSVLYFEIQGYVYTKHCSRHHHDGVGFRGTASQTAN